MARSINSSVGKFRFPLNQDSHILSVRDVVNNTQYRKDVAASCSRTVARISRRFSLHLSFSAKVEPRGFDDHGDSVETQENPAKTSVSQGFESGRYLIRTSDLNDVNVSGRRLKTQVIKRIPWSLAVVKVNKRQCLRLVVRQNSAPSLPRYFELQNGILQPRKVQASTGVQTQSQIDSEAVTFDLRETER